jgi:hypothetical protein
MERNPFVGTWRLVSLETRRPGGQVSYPLGQDAVGYLIYTEDGYMCGAMMKPDRKEFAGDDITQATIEEKVAAWDTYISYCGRYEIRDNKIIHQVMVGFFPNWVGAELERAFEFDGNRLLLTSIPFLIDGSQQTSHAMWERV